MAQRDHRLRGPWAFVLTAALCLFVGALLSASQKPPTPQGAPKAPGASVPLSFAGFHSLAATEDYLRKIASANPAITELIEIGRSTGNRPIFVLVVSNMKKGIPIDTLVPLSHPRTPAVNNVAPMKPYQAKPGQWIDAGLRGNARAGTEASLYIIDKLVTGYGADAELTKLVDDNAFYICPAPNPDALSATTDGKSVKLDSAAEGDGNFPEGWWKDDNTPGGIGDYPASLAEVRWVLEFFTNHTNILLAQSFGTGGTTTFRPFARWPDSRVDTRDIAVYDRVMGRKYLEMIGETVPASWTAPLPDRPAGAPAQPAGRGGRGAAAATLADQGAVRQARAVEQAHDWRSPYNNERQAPAGYGVFFDWAYGQFGSFAMSTQLPDVQPDALAKACEAAWQFERYKASLLPRVDITDATAKVLYTTNQATRAVATQEGDAVTIKKSGTPGRYRVIQVTATIENSGTLPTQVAAGPTLRGNREDVVWLIGANGTITFLEGSRWLRLGVLQGTSVLPQAAQRAAAAGGRGAGGGGRGGRGAAQGQLALSQMRQQRPDTPATQQAGSRRVVSWLVAVEGNAPLKLAVTSQKGGTSVKDLVVQ
jgi:hypothetical protein